MQGSLVEYESKNLLHYGKKASISGASGALKRQRSTSASWPPEGLRAKYEKFQREDGTPVYLKGGLPDRLLLGVTVVLIAIGMVDGMYTLLSMAFSKK